MGAQSARTNKEIKWRWRLEPAAEDDVTSGARVHCDEVSVAPHAGISVVVCLEEQGAASVITPEAHRDRWVRSCADELACHATLRDILPRVIENLNGHTEHLALYLSRIYGMRRDGIYDYVLMSRKGMIKRSVRYTQQAQMSVPPEPEQIIARSLNAR